MSLSSRRIDRKQLARIFGSVASLVLLLYLLSQQGWGEILAAIRRIPTASMIAVLILLLVSRVAISARWYTLLRVADASIPFREAVRLTLAGLFAANFLPTTVGGDVVRAAGVVRLSTNKVASTASIVVDRLIGMLGMFMVLPIGLAQLGSWLQGAPAAATTVPAPIALALAGLQVPARWRARFGEVRGLLGRFVGSFQLWLRRPIVILTALGFTWVHMLCLFGEIWILLQGMGDPASMTTIAGLWSLSYFITLVPVSINGLGLRELSVTYIFSELGGISLETALTLALILRTLDLLVSLPGAILIPTLPSDRADRGRAGA
jgi:uncharacterized membrane protein YbhN (UPF0104 family)